MLFTHTSSSVAFCTVLGNTSPTIIPTTINTTPVMTDAIPAAFLLHMVRSVLRRVVSRYNWNGQKAMISNQRALWLTVVLQLLYARTGAYVFEYVSSKGTRLLREFTTKSPTLQQMAMSHSSSMCSFATLTHSWLSRSLVTLYNFFGARIVTNGASAIVSKKNFYFEDFSKNKGFWMI